MAKTRDPKNDVVVRNMRKFREDVHMSTAQAALAADVPLDSMRRYESGRGGVPANVLRVLAELYGRKMDDFYAEKPAAKPDLSIRPAIALRFIDPNLDPEIRDKAQRMLEQINREARQKRTPKK